MADSIDDVDMATLLAERAIRNCITRYCRGIDRVDMDLVRSCYHPDAIDEHGSIGGDLDTYTSYLSQSLPRSEARTHFLGNVLIEVEGDRAFSEAYCFGISRRRDGDRVIQLTSAVRFLDRFEKRETGWRISHRRCVLDWSRMDDGGGQWEQTSTYLKGAGAPDDLVYTMRSETLSRT